MFSLPELAYPMNALAPHLTAETLEYHYGKHHKTYVDNLNKLVAGKPEERTSLDAIIRSAELGSPLFNNAAQAWNHAFYWNSMRPGGGGAPAGRSSMPSSATSAPSKRFAPSSPLLPRDISDPGGPGSSRARARSRSGQRMMRICRCDMTRPPCSRSTSGSTPITSTSGTLGRST